jgi:hypothetical protein
LPGSRCDDDWNGYGFGRYTDANAKSDAYFNSDCNSDAHSNTHTDANANSLYNSSFGVPACDDGRKRLHQHSAFMCVDSGWTVHKYVDIRRNLPGAYHPQAYRADHVRHFHK